MRDEIFSYSVVIPTLNAGAELNDLLMAISTQSKPPREIHVVDSQSEDDTVEIAEQRKAVVSIVPRASFNHGQTRHELVKTISTDFVLLLTQDVIIEDAEFAATLLSVMGDNPSLAVAYARQIPKDDANPLAKYARQISYPGHSYTASRFDDYPKGIRKVFCSNSAAMYRRTVYDELGGFARTNFAEDMLYAATALMKGYSINYCSEAQVKHSHNYSLRQEYARAKQIGHFHRQNSWVRSEFGAPDGAGVRYAVSMLKSLAKSGEIKWLPYATVHLLLRYLGYRVGRGLW